ncbi:MAG: paraslipin [Trichodesmium sp. MAG_R01]|nr:paraslipin [Trichodesmium sp. MAG_R01]
MLQYIIPVIATAIVSYTVNSSVKVISQGDEALVERLGKYRRTLKPGLQFVLPLVERITYVDTIRERVLDIPEQSVITNDNLTLKVDAVLYWQIIDIERAYYAIENVENAIQEIVLTSLRSQIGRLPLRQVLSTKDDIDKALLKKLDEATYNWGVKVIRVEIQNIVFPEKLRIAMESEKVALSQKQTVLSKAQAEAESIKLLSETLKLSPDSPEFIKFLIAQRYIEINHKLSESANSKVVFMHPRTMSEGVGELIGEYPDDGEIELKKVD